MNELTQVLHTVVSTLNTVRTIEMMKKAVIAVSALVCGFFVIRLWRK